MLYISRLSIAGENKAVANNYALNKAYISIFNIFGAIKCGLNRSCKAIKLKFGLIDSTIFIKLISL